MEDSAPRPAAQQAPKWRPLVAIDRRVFGVLVEKAKTTPDQYPMSINSLRTGCNQKNNRYPLMELEQEDVEESLTRLREAGAVAEVQGGSRVLRYRHYAYEWLGVDKVELAIMTELLLRGAQTEGELRGRAARMEPIADVGALRPLLASLIGKGLVLSLTPEGRGHIVTHNLYEPRELEKVRREALANAGDVGAAPASHAPASTASAPRPAPMPTPTSHTAPAPVAQAAATHVSAPVAAPSSNAGSSNAALHLVTNEVQSLRNELSELRSEMEKLRKDLDDLWSNFR